MKKLGVGSSLFTSFSHCIMSPLCPLEACFPGVQWDFPYEMTDECNRIYPMVWGLLRPERAGTKQSHVKRVNSDRSHPSATCMVVEQSTTAQTAYPFSPSHNRPTRRLHRRHRVLSPAQAKHISCNSWPVTSAHGSRTPPHSRLVYTRNIARLCRAFHGVDQCIMLILDMYISCHLRFAPHNSSDWITQL